MTEQPREPREEPREGAERRNGPSDSLWRRGAVGIALVAAGTAALVVAAGLIAATIAALY